MSTLISVHVCDVIDEGSQVKLIYKGALGVSGGWLRMTSLHKFVWSLHSGRASECKSATLFNQVILIVFSSGKAVPCSCSTCCHWIKGLPRVINWACTGHYI